MSVSYNYCIFHKGCLDGFSGFTIAYNSGQLTKDVFIYQDVPSTKKVPPNIDQRDILIIDVAYKKEILEIIFRYAKSVVFIDHHVSIHQDTIDLEAKYGKKKNITIIYDVNHAGCMLTWKFFHKRQSPPRFLKYIEDQDIGVWKYKRTKPFIYALKAYFNLSIEQQSINKWFRLMNEEYLDRIIKRGKVIKKYNDHLIGVNLSKHSRERFPSQKVFQMNPHIFKNPGQYTVAVFNGMGCPSTTDLAVEALHRIECDFVIMWALNLDNRNYVLSMRSKSVDVSKICQIFGGGGHELAAACSFSMEKMNLPDLFKGSSLPRAFKAQ